MGYYLGLLGTAKISYVAISDDSGKIITFITAPPLTIRVNNDIKYFLKITFEELCKQIGLNILDLLAGLRSVCISMSGVYFESDINELSQILNQIGFSGDFSLTICEDVNSFLAANWITHGGVISAGTGANVFFHLPVSDNIIRVDGWGSEIGDYGSGYYLGRNCLRVLFQRLDKMTNYPTILEKEVLDSLKLGDIKDLVQWFYSSRNTINWRADISDLSIPLIQAAEIHNDETAISIVNEGITVLKRSLSTAISKSEELRNFDLPPFPIILEGGLFNHSKMYFNAFSDEIIKFQNNGYNIISVSPIFLPIVGTLSLAISQSKFVNPDILIIGEMQKSAVDHNLILKIKGE